MASSKIKAPFAWEQSVPLPDDFERDTRVAWLKETLLNMVGSDCPINAHTPELPIPTSNACAGCARVMVQAGDAGVRVYFLPKRTRSVDGTEHCRIFKVSAERYAIEAEKSGMARAVEKYLASK